MKFQELRESIKADPQRRERVNAYKRAIDTALALGRLREARAVTQRELAATMAVSQANISRIEHEEDIYLSTLRSYIEALGGRLAVRAIFPDQVVEILEAELRVEEPESSLQQHLAGVMAGTVPIDFGGLNQSILPAFSSGELQSTEPFGPIELLDNSLRSVQRNTGEEVTTHLAGQRVG